MTRSNALTIEPLTPAIGAILRGVNLAEPAGEETIADIRQALLDHQVIFFEGQQGMTPAQQSAFAKRFGDLVHCRPGLDFDRERHAVRLNAESLFENSPRTPREGTRPTSFNRNHAFL